MNYCVVPPKIISAVISYRWNVIAIKIPGYCVWTCSRVFLSLIVVSWTSLAILDSGFLSVNICDGFCFVLFLWIWDWLFVVLTSRTQGRPQTKNQKVLFDSFLIVKSMRLYWSKKCLLSFIYKNCCWFLFTYLAYDCFSEKPAYYWIAFFVASERGRWYCFEASKGKHATERASERWWSSRGM